MRIPERILNQINDKADLVSIVRRHTTLKPAGKEFKGCCPFHGEKTPSFFVNPQSNLYYCFGCGVKGNAINFLIERENLSFLEAVQELAQQTGVEIPKEEEQSARYRKTYAPAQNASQSAALPAAKKATEKTPTPTAPQNAPRIEAPSDPSAQEGNLYDLLAAVAAFYQDALKKHAPALRYLADRQIHPQSLSAFGLGYAPSDWRHLQRAFANDIEGLKMLGLVRTSQKGNDFNLFRDRLMFPIKDGRGNVVGFAGRALDDDTLPKYLNSTDSAIFQKHHILYGYYEARQKRARDWLVVEGYMDVIALHQAGVYGAVAPMGTAVHQNQLAHLFKFNDTLTLCFDGDAAGQKAAFRALDVALPILSDGRQLKFLTLPDNHDPDSFVRQFGKEAIDKAMQEAAPLSDFLFAFVAQKYDLRRPEDKARALAHIKEHTSKLPQGSSFRWLLNSEMYNRLKWTGRQAPAAYRPLPKIEHSDQLLLCLLYCPALLCADPLARLYQNAEMAAVDAQFAQNLDKNAVALPSWEQLQDGACILVDAILALLPFLPAHNDDSADNDRRVEANAHAILSALGDETLQAKLASQWRDFFETARRYSVEQTALLFDELLCNAVVAALRQNMQKADNLKIATLQKKRILALQKWDKQNIKPTIEQTFTAV